MAERVSEIQLIVGLGNPGAEYKDTRHNAGAWFIEALCQQYRLSLKIESKFNALLTKWTFGGKECKILIPNTYMNHSGQAVGSIAKYYQIPTEAILIAHDELDLAPGIARLKIDGGHGGHNGLRDIIHHLQNRAFHRLRLGIGHPGHKDEVSQYVLQRPIRTDEQKIRSSILGSLKILPQLMVGDWQNAMNHLHTLTN